MDGGFFYLDVQKNDDGVWWKGEEGTEKEAGYFVE